MTQDNREAVAIIGLGGIFPQANDIGRYWANILEGKDSVIEVPPERWDWRLYYDPDPKAVDKTYSKIGGFVRDFVFEPLRYRIPAPVAAQMDTVQQLVVAAVDQALKDAGGENRMPCPERTAVILGNSMGGPKKDLTDLRVYSAFIKERLRRTPAYAGLGAQAQALLVSDLEAEINGALCGINEDTMPGELSNVIAGRVANIFNFNGPNFTVDAACASSLAAVDMALKGLRLGDFDVAVCGGVDQMMGPPNYVKFCKIGALSPDGSRPFDAGANGFVMGEGAGILILKRLSDARRDGDRVYAVLRSAGSSSDGRGKGITAPNPRGQKLAVERAFSGLDYGPGEVGLIEAHGTSTKAGDAAEMQVLNQVFGPHASPGGIGLGSVKSQIGHLKAAAGAAGLIKAALALHHKVLPPSIHFQTPNPGVDWSRSPLRVLTSAEEWKAPSGKGIRRANVSAFGFGGTNFHVAMQEEKEPALRTPDLRLIGKENPPLDPHRLSKLQGEVCVISGSTPEEVKSKVEKILANDCIKNIFSYTETAINASPRPGESCAVFHAENADKFRQKLELILKEINSGTAFNKQEARFKPHGVYFFRPPKNGEDQPKIGFLFPGQGSQYVDMLRDLRDKYEVVRETYEEADGALQPVLGRELSSIVFSPEGASPERILEQEEILKRTEYTQPAVLTADVALLRLLSSYGLKPDAVCGHSLGEYGALVAAGVLEFKDALLAVSARAKEMASVQVPDPGRMASVPLSADKVEPVLRSLPGYVAIANKNCPAQTVIAGETAAVQEALRRFQAEGIPAQEISVSHAFHSKIVAPAQEAYGRVLKGLPIQPPRVPVLSNVTADYYPRDAAEIHSLLVRQIAAPVEFTRQIERLYSDGVRLFIEIGPKRVLSAFVGSILEGKKDAVALASNHPRRGGIVEFNDLLARLVAAGVRLRFPERPAAFYTAAYRNALEAAAGEGKEEPPQKTETTVSADILKRHGFNLNPVVVSGIAAGIPGTWDRLFRENGLDEILAGQNLIEKLPENEQEKQVAKNIVRLVKSETGDHRLERLSSTVEAVKLCARAGGFDLREEFGLSSDLAQALDITSQMAIAAGLLALKDAGIPLVRAYRTTSTGGRMPTGWALPEPLQAETGVIFASAFPGQDSLISEISRHLADRFSDRPLRELESLVQDILRRTQDSGDKAALEAVYARHLAGLREARGEGVYQFSRDFLLKVLAMGHSQLSQWIQAKGPSVHVNAACASTTLAVGLAQDWIRVGRARRVLVVGADDITRTGAQEWYLPGFLAAGAATTESAVSRAALPFDRRRHGMIVGAGAVGLVIEDGELVGERGMRALAEVLASAYENSAFHATRLDTRHVAEVMERVVAAAERRHGLDRRELAGKTLFMSHETYTPARGGSAAAEVEALKRTFGPQAGKVVVCNTKGFTGHTMAASLEDPVAIRALTTGKVPPIANYKEPDPELSGIQLSDGGERDIEYALRLAAGFGSQIALTLTRRLLRKGEERVLNGPLHKSWLAKVSGQADPELEVVKNTLRVRETGQPPRAAPRPEAVLEKPGPAAAAAAKAPLDETSVKADILKLVSEKTGYPREMLELGLDMEADLGIDTVKQAELIGILRERYGLERREALSLKDYPTLGHVVRFVMEGGGAEDPVSPAAPSDVFRRLVLRARPAAASGPGLPLEKGEGNILLAGKGDLAKVFKKELECRGIRVLHLADAGRTLTAFRSGTSSPEGSVGRTLTAFRSGTSSPEGSVGHSAGDYYRVRWDQPETILQALDQVQAVGPLAGIVYIPELSTGKKDAPFDAAFRRTVLPLFLLAKALRQPPKWLALLTQMGSVHGLMAPAPFDPLAGALTGLAKALAREWPGTLVKALDFDPEETPALRVQKTVEELSTGDRRVEVGWHRGKRHVIELEHHPLSTPPEDFGPETVFVVTGGGQGLGAEFAKELARRFKPCLALLGRTALESESARWAAMTPEETQGLRARTWERLKVEDPKTTPAQLERAFSKILKSAEVYRTLEALRAAGARADYFACDLADEKAAQAALSGILARFGKVDALVHAAGLEESKLLADKTPEAFQRVFAAKAHGAMHLLAALPEDPKRRHLFFSSIAGRFGNAGQSDYAAASDYLGKLAGALRARGLHAVSADLTAISEIGMATRGGIQAHLKSQGLEFMPPRAAVGLLMDELTRPTPEAEVVLAGELGKLAAPEQRSEAGRSPTPLRRDTSSPDGSVGRTQATFGGDTSSPDGSVAPPRGSARSLTQAPRGPLSMVKAASQQRSEVALPRGSARSATPVSAQGALIDKAERKDGLLIVHKTFSIESDPYLSDHALGATPLVPGVMGLELFAEALAAAGKNCRAFSQVRFSLPIKLLRLKPQAVRCLVKAGKKGPELEIESDFLLPSGARLGSPRRHFSAVLDERAEATPPLGLQFPLPKPRPAAPAVAKAEIYRAYFHGPRFQVLDGILEMSEERVLALYRRPAAPLWNGPKPGLLSQPLLIEAAFQACGWRGLRAAQQLTLPDSIGSALILREGEPPETLYALARFLGTEDGKSRYDAVVYDSEGRPWVELRDYRMIPAA